MKRILLILLVFFSIVSQAQDLSGKVTDVSGLPLPGATVLHSSGASTIADFDGNFSMAVPVGDLLTFEMMGFESKTIAAANNMIVTLKEQVNKLNEVVVIGYGAKKLGSITGSVSQIKAAEILKTPAQSAIQAIQGKAAGVNIVTNDEPGADPTIRIRGLGTVLGNRNPLYVINGVESGGLNGISPNDIETIDILKDASSLAIYGQKGANGVVIITTKRGKKGEMKITYDSYYGEKSILNKVDMADSYRYAYYSNTALGSSTYFNFTQPYNTNWLSEITRTGTVSSNAVALSGANENTNYSLSVTHYTEKGILEGTDFKRTNLVNRNEYKLLNDRLKISNFVNLSLSHNTPKPLSAFTNAYKQAPIVPVRYPNGRWGVPLVNLETGISDLNGTEYAKFNNVGNPVAQLFFDNTQTKSFILTGSLAAELKLYKDLTFTSNFGTTAEWNKGYRFTADREIAYAQDPFLTPDGYDATFGNNTPRENTLTQARSDSYIWNWDNYLTYKKQFGVHDLTVVLGMSRTTKDNSEYLSGTRKNVPAQTNYWYLNFATDNDITTTSLAATVSNSHSTPIVSLAYFARAEYELMEKYLLTAIIRREGISPFQTNKKIAYFPAVSAGWIVSKEAFLANSKFINNLKLRGGYGEVGNGNGETFNNTTFTPNANYTFGNTIYPGSYIANANDPNLTWEAMREIDLGLDFALWNNKITGTFDYYNRKSDDIILLIPPPLVLSEQDAYLNAGQITNKGFEATLRWDDNINDKLRYWIGGNFSKNDNTVSRIDSRFFQNFSGAGGLGNGVSTKRVYLNEPLGSFYVYQQIGYNADGAPLYNDLVDGVAGLSDNDLINAGSYIPDYTYGVQVGINYRNIDFTVDGYGVGGNKVYNGKKAQRFGNENIEYDILDSFWTPSTPNAANPKPNNEVPAASTYFIEDGSFFRINNITLGYTIPKIEKVDKVRLYVTAVNPFIFTKYSGYSPEVVGGNGGDPLGGAGIELDAYPTNKTFLVGLNVAF